MFNLDVHSNSCNYNRGEDCDCKLRNKKKEGDERMIEEKEKKIRIVCEDVLSAKWFCSFEDHDDNSVTLIRYWRAQKKEDWPPEYELNRSFRLIIEDKDRNAIHLNIDGMFRKVRNPKHIFDYKG